MEDDGMVDYNAQKIKSFIKKGVNAPNSREKGKALEDLVCYLFLQFNGIELYDTDVMNFHKTEEIDIVLWNEQKEDLLKSLPNIIFIECKNLKKNVGTQDVAYFITKLRNKGLTFGILIASFGITGSEKNSDRAHFEIPIALSDGIRVIIITINDIIHLSTTHNLIKLIKQKICSLYVKGSIQL